MADVWISRKRWTCKYCDLTINDDIPSRRQHENGLRHKGNVERVLQQTYRKGERERKEAEQAKREIDKIEKAALSSFSLDQAAGAFSRSPPAKDKDKAAIDTKTAAWKPKDKFAAYSSAQSLGFDEDPEIKRRQQQEEERKQKGFAGEWETITPAQAPAAPASTSTRVAAVPLPQTHGFTSERQQARSFKLKERETPTHDDDEDGLGEIKVKKRIKVEASQGAGQGEAQDGSRKMPNWTPLKLEKSLAEVSASKPEVKAETPLTLPEEPQTTAPQAQAELQAGSDASLASQDESADVTKLVKTEGASDVLTSPPAEPSSGGDGLFKKRQAGAGAGAKKVRALI